MKSFDQVETLYFFDTVDPYSSVYFWAAVVEVLCWDYVKLAEGLTYIQTCHIILGGRKHHSQDAFVGWQQHRVTTARQLLWHV